MLLMPTDGIPSAQSPEAPATCTDEHAQLLTERWARDMREKNLKDIMVMLSNEPMFIEPSGKKYRGRKSVRRLYERALNTFDSDITMKGHSLQPSRDRCSQVGRFSENLRDRSTGAVTQYLGTYEFTYLLLPSGAWLLSRQQWSLAHLTNESSTPP